MVSGLNSQETKYKNPTPLAIAGGVIAGGITNSAVKIGQDAITGLFISRALKNTSKNISTDEFKQLETAIENTINNSGLKEKGVEIIKATKENSKKITDIISKDFSCGVMKFAPKSIKEFLSKNVVSQIEDGANALYAVSAKKIIMPEGGKLGLALFHEAGHAMNANLSKFGKVLQKCRPLTLLAIPISLIALLKTKKAPDEQPKNKLDKATTFIKNNAGKLTFAAFLPAILEEGLASLKGNKFAKQLLSPDLAKKVAKTNALGFTSYLLAATLSAVGLYAGVKVKDAIAHKKEIKENQN